MKKLRTIDELMKDVESRKLEVIKAFDELVAESLEVNSIHHYSLDYDDVYALKERNPICVSVALAAEIMVELRELRREVRQLKENIDALKGEY